MAFKTNNCIVGFVSAAVLGRQCVKEPTGNTKVREEGRVSEWAIHVPERGSCCHTGTRSTGSLTNRCVGVEIDLGNQLQAQSTEKHQRVTLSLYLVSQVNLADCSKSPWWRETESKDEKWKEESVARMQRAALSRVPKPKTYTNTTSKVCKMWQGCLLQPFSFTS